jgi:class 3 adenylate cyclase
MRGHGPEQATRVGALFLGGGGLAGLAAAAIAAARPAAGWNPGLLALLAGAAVAAAIAVYAAAPRLSLGSMQVITALAAVFIGVAQVLACPGGESYGPMLLLWPVLWAFTYLPFAHAARIAAVCAAVLAWVFATQDGWPNPMLYWVFLSCTFFVTAATMTVLVRRAEFANRELHHLNDTLESRVVDQVAEIERLARLRRFLSPQVADAVLRADTEESLALHRREIAALFLDLRGFTSFAAVAEPEDVTEVLAEYHAAIGALVEERGATVGAFAGDGVMLFFNDPLPCDDPAYTAVRFALDVAPPMEQLAERWARKGFSIGYGVGIALGYATVGMTGFTSRSEYTALGSVVNLASRLCDEAAPGEILLDRRASVALDDRIATELVGEKSLKGFSQDVSVYRVAAERSDQRSRSTARASEA